MEETKIQLSEDELLLMKNSDWILTKNGIIEKVSRGFGDLIVKMQRQIAADAGSHNKSIDSVSPKISKGEKYEGLPYVILDYPRIFGKEDVLAIRTLFWWGNYCSVTLHVKGSWQKIVLQKLTANYHKFNNSSWFISLNGNEWSHNIRGADYIKFESLPGEEILQELPATGFLKLAAIIQIAAWSEMEKELFDLFLDLVELIKT